MQYTKVAQLHPQDSQYDRSLFSGGIIAIGVKNYLQTAVRFCKEEARDGRMEIVSVGSGNGRIERAVNAAYRERYPASSDLNFVLVDPDPQFDGIVDFDYVDDLIEKRPAIVGNCVLFIIWPMPVGQNDGYDIDSIRKLQPRAVLIVYMTLGSAGSEDLLKALGHDDNFQLPLSETGIVNWVNAIEEETFGCCEQYGIENYSRKDVYQQKISAMLAGTKIRRLTILNRMNDPRYLNACPVINVTCERNSLINRRGWMRLIWGAGVDIDF